MSKQEITELESISCLFTCCTDGNLEQFKSDINNMTSVFPPLVENNIGNLLHVAAYYGHTEIVKYLIEKLNVNVNSISEEGNTPLYLAKSNAKYYTTEYLNSIGAEYMEPENAKYRINSYSCSNPPSNESYSKDNIKILGQYNQDFTST